jgi:subtilisin family serine protease
VAVNSKRSTPAPWNAGATVLDIVGVPDDGSLETALSLYARCPGVRFVEPDRRLGLAAMSNDPLYTTGALWGMYGGDQPTSVGPIGTSNPFGSQTEAAWAAGHTGSRSVCIGIVDQGVDFSHPDLIANAWINPYDPLDGIDNDGNGYIDDIHGWDFVHDDNTVFDAGADQHGTHVAGTIGASGGNGLGVAGISWEVSLIAAKFLGPDGGTTADAIRAIDYLTDLKLRHGIRLVASNNSWGGGGASQALADAIARAAMADILFIAAAGNSAADNDVSPTYPASFSTIPTAGYEAVVAVASLTDSGTLSGFSNSGRTSVDLAAPGSGILSTLPGESYGIYSGTSMATPHVTGAVALYAANHPEATAEEIRTALLQSTTATPALAGRTVTGGRLDVARMLDSVVPASLAISPVEAVQAEGNRGSTLFTFSVTRSRATGAGSSVAWAVATPATGGATADDFVDGVLPGGQLLFAPGERRKTISVAVATETSYEACEDFVVTLDAPHRGRCSPPPQPSARSSTTTPSSRWAQPIRSSFPARGQLRWHRSPSPGSRASSTG